MMRTEFGFPRTECGCRGCRLNCEHMPGMLIPADLLRMIPTGADPFDWSEHNLLASPGALVQKGSERFRIPTLVPAKKPDGSCIHLQDGRCAIHPVAPFGCAHFDCRPEHPKLSTMGLLSIMGVEAYDQTHQAPLYHAIWQYLSDRGKTQNPPEVVRQRMAACL